MSITPEKAKCPKCGGNGGSDPSQLSEKEKRKMAAKAAKEMLKLFPPGEAEESRLAEWVYQSAERERKAWRMVRGIR